MKRLPEKLVTLISRAGVHQAQVAREVGVDPSQFGKWLKGEQRPTAERLLAVARYFGVPMDYLADDAVDEPPAGYTAEERALIGVYRGSGYTLEEAVGRLTPRPNAGHNTRLPG